MGKLVVAARAGAGGTPGRANLGAPSPRLSPFVRRTMTTAKSDGFWRLVRERAFDMLDDPVVLRVEQADAARP
jgi:hypothetical protein